MFAKTQKKKTNPKFSNENFSKTELFDFSAKTIVIAAVGENV